MALSHRIDERRRLLDDAQIAREQARQRLQRLVDAIEEGVTPFKILSAKINEREADLARLDAVAWGLVDDSLRQRLAVMPAWVRQELEDLSGLLSETPERTKTEFQRLGLRVSMAPISHVAPRAFYRATVEAALPCLAGIRDFSATRKIGDFRWTSQRTSSDRLAPTAG